MKAMNFHFGEAAVTGAWARFAFEDIFGRFLPATRRQSLAVAAPVAATKRARISLFERLDRWTHRQQQRELEAWLSGSQDVFELESRIRKLESSVGSRYY
jgi:hypothetical protein